jgi:pimeloyl-ACP methyl ester carboxylesterase
VLRPRHLAAVPVERGFLRLPHGDVHFRAAGAGPLVLALHESPRSSLSLLPVLDALSSDYRVVAPDTPGYGLSDALPGDAPSMDQYLDVLAGVLDALGAPRAIFFGAHTGAALAVAFADRYPDRVVSLTLDGLSVFTPQEVEDFRTRYLAPYQPRWDGSHVMSLWSRVKDLFTWFPWYDQTSASRLIYEPGDLEALQKSALGFLQAGSDYAKAYTHAAGYDPNPALRSLTAPATVMAKPDDLIAHHLQRLGPDCGCDIRWLSPEPADWRAALRDAVGRGEGAGPVSAIAAGEEGNRFTAVGDGWLHTRHAGPAGGPIRLLVPDLPGDLDALVARQRADHPGARLVVISPPGCGWSDPLAHFSVDGVLDAMDAALRGLDLEPASAAGEGASSLLAALWAQRRGWAFAPEAIDAPAWVLRPELAPTRPLLEGLPLRWDGAHFTSAWFQVRDLALYDVPPGRGVPVRRALLSDTSAEALDRRFRNYIEGPDCAALLAAVVDLSKTRPELAATLR